MAATATTAGAARGEGAAEVTSRVWHGVLALVIAVSLVTQIVLIFTGGADANSGDVDTSDNVGVRLVRLVSFFTIQSNIVVLATALVLVWRPRYDGRVWRVVRLDALLGIAITGVVFATVLAPLVHLEGVPLAVTIGFHYISPWLTLLGWLLYGPRPRFTWGTVAAAFIWPLLWLVYTFVRGAIGHWYPYPFLDVDELGYAVALRNVVFVLLVAVVFAAGIKLIDRHFPAWLRDTGRR
jgi:hypothetical protein